MKTITAQGAFAFQALKEVLGENCKFESIDSDAITFMDRTDGSKFEITAGHTSLYCTRLINGERQAHTDLLAQKMRQRLLPAYERHYLNLEKAQQEIELNEQRSKRRAKMLAGVEL